ncbi:MAG: hypothetical protein Q8L54_02415 [Devosia sp.]|nr:hypothetical protein [Devosia sp.]
MADYKELLRRAVEALPENNGAARRAVYEKARAALVGQLRAISPPLAARDITTHRLQLEDCIRQVEQEASEAVIAGMSNHEAAPPPPVYFEAPAAKALPAASRTPAKPVPAGKGPPKPLPAGGTIEDIILAANTDTGEQKQPEPATRAVAKPVPVRLASSPRREPEPGAEPEEDAQEVLPPKPATRPDGRPLPSIVARAEAARGRPVSTVFGMSAEKPYDAPRRGPTLEPRRDGPRLEPAARGAQAVARQQVAEPAAFMERPQVAAAMSAVREVEVEPQPADPQGAIDRAIATLDREARGEAAPAVNGFDVEMDEDDAPVAPQARKKGIGKMFPGGRGAEPAAKPGRRTKPAKPAREARPAKGRGNREVTFAETGFPRARPEAAGEGTGAVTIFLVVFAVLLAGAGGAGFWAVNQGYIDLQAMFGGRPAAQAAPVATQPAVAEATAPATGPGNTAAPAETPAPVTELKAEERLTPEPALTGAGPLALQATGEDGRSEQRLGTAANGEPAENAEAAVAAFNPVNLAGSQSLLLEASDDGTTGAVPFSGTVDWSKGTDETGLPTLIGKASIPARNLGVDVLIRKNSDPSLPASHLMEINFRVSDSFIGGSVAGLPGVLLKNEELVQGAPLVGASARVVGNSFLFALSASPEDMAANNTLLTSRKWMDLALIYATGKRAIITLEKDAQAEAMFKEVFAAWSQTASGQ